MEVAHLIVVIKYRFSKVLQIKDLKSKVLHLLGLAFSGLTALPRFGRNV